MRGVDTDLVERAQHGDREAFGLLAADLATRFLAVSRRILRDIDLAEDATQQALVAIWRDLPQLRDPARFDAWSYRLLVRACYAEGRRSRQWSPNLRILPADEPAASGGVDSVIHRDQLETAIRRLSVDHRTVLVLHHYADIPARAGGPDPGDPGRHGPLPTPSRDARHAGGTRCRRAPGGSGGNPMTTERDPRTRIVLSWLREDAHENAERVLLRALDEVDTTPQRRSWWPAWRIHWMNTYATRSLPRPPCWWSRSSAIRSWHGDRGSADRRRRQLADPRDAFLGTWVSTSDPGFGTRTMTVERRDERTVEVVVTDTIEAACDLTPSTMSGTGSVEGNVLVIPAPEYTCDDGSEPQALSGPTLNEDLRNLTYTRDPQTGALWARDDIWVRPEVVIPGPTSNPI